MKPGAAVTSTNGAGLVAWMEKAAVAYANEIKMAAADVTLMAVYATPIDSGRLRESEGWFIMGVGFGTTAVVYADTPYALYVHENLGISHPIHEGRNCRGGAKFLSRPARLRERLLVKNLVKSLSAVSRSINVNSSTP